MSATRYVLSGARDLSSTTYEIPVVVRGHRKPVATLAIDAAGLFYALTIALDWAKQFARTKDYPHWPTVFYKGRRYEVHRVSSSTAWIENHSRGQWVPIERLSA